MQQRPSARPPHAPVDEPRQPSDAVRVQILATEHWSLLATRSMLWSEAFTRATMFLTALSAAVVALALIAQAAGEEETFTLFVVLLLPVMLVVGLATYVRINRINDEDERLVAGMNRLRRGYLDIAPDLEPYLPTSVMLSLATTRIDGGMLEPLPALLVLCGYVGAAIGGAAFTLWRKDA